MPSLPVVQDPQLPAIIDAEIVEAAAHLPPETSVRLSPAVSGLLNNRLAIVAVILVAGPLGLPALWFSGRFSRTTKVASTIAYFLVTIVFPIALIYYWCEIALRPLVDAFSG